MGQGVKALAAKSQNPYRVTSASMVGRSHAATNTPCQDFAAGRRTPVSASIALADGAGSRKHSEVGARVVVQACLRMMESQFDDIFALCEHGQGAAQQFIHKQLLEVLEQEAQEMGCALGDLACTLLFVAHNAGRFIAGHVGDGVIAQVQSDGSACTLSHPENGEYANTTMFMTDAAAGSRLRIQHGDASKDLSGYMLMSDGCAESLYDKQSGQPAAAVGKMVEWNATLSRNALESILQGNLAQAFTRKSADDCSLAILSIQR